MMSWREPRRGWRIRRTPCHQARRQRRSRRHPACSCTATSAGDSPSAALASMPPPTARSANHGRPAQPVAALPTPLGRCEVHGQPADKQSDSNRDGKHLDLSRGAKQSASLPQQPEARRLCGRRGGWPCGARLAPTPPIAERGLLCGSRMRPRRTRGRVERQCHGTSGFASSSMSWWRFGLTSGNNLRVQSAS
jgi:hypothetical protein